MKLIATALALSLMFATGASHANHVSHPYGAVRCPPGNARCVAAFQRLYKQYPTGRAYNKAARKSGMYKRGAEHHKRNRTYHCRRIKVSQYTYRWDCQ